MNARPETVGTAATSDEAEPATESLFCKVTFCMERPASPVMGDPGGEALPTGRPIKFRASWRDATLRYDGERAGMLLVSSTNRVARPPFVVSEISDSKAAPGKPAARAKTGGNCPRRGDSDRSAQERKPATPKAQRSHRPRRRSPSGGERRRCNRFQHESGGSSRSTVGNPASVRKLWGHGKTYFSQGWLAWLLVEYWERGWRRHCVLA